MNLTLTQHALSRIRQRGLRESDISVIVGAGTPVDDDSLLLLGQDVDREIRRRKQEINALERLRGCRVVIAGETVITVYRPSRKTERLLLRGQHRQQAIPADHAFRALPIHDGGHSDAS
ncbi:DUF4258 domain-containing protein [Thiocystis violacea]|uniref:DUF4258 domain-containing protein n=1 Tax=Thiocystis violacea TaxID=13725 RepID=UPI0019043188|nr:DUF4258 domain-containing protein [Thiocystis violacea]MBK1719314.1 hypothetical protein [Thiocystis violacea]